MSAKLVVLTRREAGRLARLLGAHQRLLESAIDSALVDGEAEPREEFDRLNVEIDRHEWRAAEDMVMRLAEANREAVDGDNPLAIATAALRRVAALPASTNYCAADAANWAVAIALEALAQAKRRACS